MAAQDRPLCDGRGDANGDHCCYVRGRECPYLERDTVPGRHYACGLLRELGTWGAVYADARYIDNVKREWLAASPKRIGWVDCGDFPTPNEIGRCRSGIDGRIRACCFSRPDSPPVPNDWEVDPGVAGE